MNYMTHRKAKQKNSSSKIEEKRGATHFMSS